MEQEEIIKNQRKRKAGAKADLGFFVANYFRHYLDYDSPPFHDEIYGTLEGDEQFIELLAFRDSAKSSITSLFYPVWEVINDRYNFILVSSYSGKQVKQLFQNIRTEFETNKLLQKDFGPFATDKEWTSKSVIVSQYDTKIVGKSVGESSRGMRFKQYRPDLACFDDIEEDEAMKTQERRDKLDNWFRRVMMPAISNNARVVLSGSLLHRDSLMKRIADEIETGSREGKLLKYPLYENNPEDNLWQAKYPDKEAVDKKRKSLQDPIGWRREFLLEIIAEEGQIVNWKDIEWYEKIPEKAEIIRTVIAVDLAISEKDTADYTAITVFSLTVEDGSYKIYCEDYSNKRTGFKDTLDDIDQMHSKYPHSIVLIEDISYQKAAIETLQQKNYSVNAISFKGDKRSRLQTVSPLFKKGKVHFKESQREAAQQVVGLGVEKHDDICDSIVYALYNIQRHMSDQSLQDMEEAEDSRPITSGLLNKKF